ncbi:MAG: hypothetical protein M1609_02550 [Firmicutes bacterium]|nr:hypothetical protein [Bacillota bacterium]
MFSKKAMIVGVSTLMLGVSMVGAAYALPMNKAPLQPQQPQAQMQTMSVQKDDTQATMPVNVSIKNAKVPTENGNGKAMSNIQDISMNKQKPAQMNQQMNVTMGQQMTQYHQQMGQNMQQMMQNNEQMQQNHQQMTENHQAMSQDHQPMSGSSMSGNGHMGFANSK